MEEAARLGDEKVALACLCICLVTCRAQATAHVTVKDQNLWICTRSLTIPSIQVQAERKVIKSKIQKVRTCFPPVEQGRYLCKPNRPRTRRPCFIESRNNVRIATQLKVDLRRKCEQKFEPLMTEAKSQLKMCAICNACFKWPMSESFCKSLL